MNPKKYFSLISFLFLALFLSLNPSPSRAEAVFNPGLLISDQDLLNYNSMNLGQIQKFLENYNSYLATYKTTSAYGLEKTAAEIIYDAAVNNYDCDGVSLSDQPTEEERRQKCKKITTISPKVLLVMLQKEQSLVESRNPKDSQLDWAMGYGCPDSWACNPYYKGFGKQVNSTALQFRWYMINPNLRYQVGETYTFTNPYGTINNSKMDVTIESKATAALYTYTPHVYNGNYNFWKLWNKYFPSHGYPNNTLLKIGENYYLIQNGFSRKFSSKSVVASRTSLDKAIVASQAVLDAYPEGVPINFPNYSIIMSPDGKLYLLVDDKKRLFSTNESFKRLGFNVEEIINASWQDINSYNDGPEITLSTAYPTGALLQNKKTGGVYWVEEKTKAPLLDKVFLKTKFKNKEIIPVEEKELNNYETIDPVKLDDGELLKGPESPAVYLINEGRKQAFISGEVFEELGYSWSNIIIVPERVLDLYSQGEIIE